MLAEQLENQIGNLALVLFGENFKIYNRSHDKLDILQDFYIKSLEMKQL